MSTKQLETKVSDLLRNADYQSKEDYVITARPDGLEISYKSEPKNKEIGKLISEHKQLFIKRRWYTHGCCHMLLGCTK